MNKLIDKYLYYFTVLLLWLYLIQWMDNKMKQNKNDKNNNKKFQNPIEKSSKQG